MGCVLLLLLIITATCSAQTTMVSVKTSRGIVTGVNETTPVIYYRYSGIPYATVTARFKAPTPLTVWNQTVVANKEGPICPQIPDSRGSDASSEQNENCLFLNIYTPVAPSAPTKFPVMVFIHGGGFLIGSGNRGSCGPDFFMLEGGIVLVTFNYRLGVFGFLSTGAQGIQGNAGMKDQVEALKWIKQEISYFGGDPDNITIFGESAGAASVIYHLLSPMSQGKFRRAIAQSGTALADWAYKEANDAQNYAIRVTRNLGCDATNITATVRCLNIMPVSELLEQSTRLNVLTPQETLQDFLVFAPVVETKIDEDVFLANHPEILTDQINKTIPLMIGINKDEGISFFSGNNSMYTLFDKNLPNFIPRQIRRQTSTSQMNTYGEMLRKFYFGGRSVNETVLKDIINLLTDQLFMYPAVETVRRLVDRQTHDVYLYDFAYIGGYRKPYELETKLGYQAVARGEELGYLFYSSLLNQNFRNTSSNDYKTMQKMVKLWKAFAINGKPENPNDEIIKGIQWSKVANTNLKNLTYLEMKMNFSEAYDYYKERIAFWDGIIHPSSSLMIQPTVLVTLASLILGFKNHINL